MIPRRVLIVLVAAAGVLPLAIVILVAAARLLAGMQDPAAATVLDRVALAGGVLWALNLVCLLLAVGINALGPPPGSGSGS